MLYLLLVLLTLAVTIYIGWRLMHTPNARPKTRVIGPDDDPEFLWRLGRRDGDTPQR